MFRPASYFNFKRFIHKCWWELKRKLHSHPRLFVLSIVPPIAGLGDQQGYHIILREAEQGAVVTGCMGEDGLDSSSAVSLQPRCHGAGPGQRTGLRWQRVTNQLTTLGTTYNHLLVSQQLMFYILKDSIFCEDLSLSYIYFYS